MFKKLILALMVIFSGVATAENNIRYYKSKSKSKRTNCCERATQIASMPFLWAMEAIIWSMGPKQS